MKKYTRYLGLDVHAETIAAAVCDGDGGEVRYLGTIANSAEAIGKLVKQLNVKPVQIKACYEAGCCGYVVHEQLKQLKVDCDVIAPTLIPKRAGERVKTDRKDAEKLSRLLRSGELVAVHVPDDEQRRLRDLLRAREGVKKDQLRARHRVSKFLLRIGMRRPQKTKAWGTVHLKWLEVKKFESPTEQATWTDCYDELLHQNARLVRIEQAVLDAIGRAPEWLKKQIDALGVLRGLSTITAATVVAEVGHLSRFDSPKKLMAYAGIVPSEHSSGGPGKASRGSITKTGNAHIRRVIVQAAWTYAKKPALGKAQQRRLKDQPSTLQEIGNKARARLCEKYRKISERKTKQLAVTAVARELLGFIWAVGIELEKPQQQKEAA